MTPEDRRGVEAEARRIVEYERWRERHGQGGRAFPHPAIEVLEEYVGGFILRTVKLAKRALKRAREIEGREVRSEGVPPTYRRASRLPEYGSRRGGGVSAKL